MVGVVIPVLYPATERTFSNNGLGGLPDALSCIVTNELNTVGGYFLGMEYPINGLHFDDLVQERIIYASPAPGKAPQPFHISRIQKGITTAAIEAPHVSAGLQKIVTHGSISTKWPGLVIDHFLENAVPASEAVEWTRSQTSHSTADGKLVRFLEPVPMMDVLMGTEGSVLDQYGGEYEFDGWSIKLYASIGTNTGLEIRRGVNITDISAETDDSNLVTAVLPYYKGTQNNAEVFVYGSVCNAPTVSNFANIYCVPLDVSGQFQNLAEGTLPTSAQVTAAGQHFVNSTSANKLLTSFSISFTPNALTATDSGAVRVRNVYLGDTVRVVYPEFGVSVNAKVVKTEYNVLLDRYDSVTIGSIRRNAADTIAALVRNTNNQKIMW